MSLQRISYPDRESWLNGRQRGIGGSDAASVVGLSKWRSSTQLFEEKTGKRGAKDLSGVEYVERGIRSENAIREFFAASYPDYYVEHHAFDILYQSERPWLFATLDGEITETGWKDPPEGTSVVYIPANGEPEERPFEGRIPYTRHGVLEIKTARPQGKLGWAEWDGKIPGGYYAQCLHQLLATNYDFMILYAALYGRDESVTFRPYTLERTDCQADLDWLLDQEEQFWRCVETGVNPGATLRF